MGTAFAQWLDVISRSGIPAADPAPITPVAPLHPQIVHGERGGSSGPHASSPPLTCRESCILISFVVALVPGPNLSLVIVVVLTVRFQLAFVIISPPAPVSRQKLLTVTLVGCRLPGFLTLEVPAIRRPVGPTRTFEAVTVSAAFSVTVNRECRDGLDGFASRAALFSVGAYLNRIVTFHRRAKLCTSKPSLLIWNTVSAGSPSSPILFITHAEPLSRVEAWMCQRALPVT
ncbi:Uncharacterised protein [Mycobacteroides abscessus subsp. abscessus]|nr:Uncharacterised protein [Mycobacteroides abscessus subsp. abscessus]SID83741.1 Uncharacterised protein [Mycobacteroides abscessus subsp. abscessus]SII41750.1 Uncharacterised protein [Mycobacteroides abscessus subsp. abscessus]SII86640.1 Uncharacterised protein [Mycobacteroides abscessus subsp. abscessus]SKR68612.1 Uncharacterised protein [Mycobacteroides abscessus subsp. abscessus]